MIECSCPIHASRGPDEIFPRAGKITRARLNALHSALVELQEAHQQITRDDIVSGLGAATAGSLPTIAVAYPCLTEIISDYLPPAESLILLAERNLGVPCSGENLEDIREEVHRLAKAVGARLKGGALRTLLAPLIVNGQVMAPADAVVTLLTEQYESAVRSANNGAIVLAGRVHELVLQRSLELEGLILGRDFDTPPKRLQQGDIRLHSRTDRNQLRTEVKSLAARERFKRGLQEIHPPKVGVGFFTDATEFGTRQTRGLLEQGVAAVYLPSSTLAALVEDSRGATNASGRAFYRPVSAYPSDMKSFVVYGMVP